MSVENSISSAVKGYHHCPFKVKEGEVFSVSKKRGESHGNTFKESTMNDILVFNKSQKNQCKSMKTENHSRLWLWLLLIFNINQLIAIDFYWLLLMILIIDFDWMVSSSIYVCDLSPASFWLWSNHVPGD